MNTYALDTNTVSYLLNKNQKIIKKINDVRENSNKIIVPPMVYFEVKRGLLYIKAAAKLNIFESLFLHTGIDSMDRKTLDMAISVYLGLRSTGIIIDDADMLIAAYCIQKEYILVSNNTKHFSSIDTLQVENWA